LGVALSKSGDLRPNLDAEVNKQAERMTTEERANTYLNIEIEYE
jgi:hypothetical protein